MNTKEQQLFNIRRYLTKKHPETQNYIKVIFSRDVETGKDYGNKILVLYTLFYNGPLIASKDFKEFINKSDIGWE